MRQSSTQPLVLVADDDAATRYLCAETLGHEGFRVVEAANGEDAVERWQTHRPDLVLLDVEMPVRDGYYACTEILKAETGVTPPVVMMTTHDDRESIDRAFDLGATDFIAKPISWPLIGHRLRYVLRGWQNLHDLGETLAENRALLAAFPDHILVLDRTGIVRDHLHGDGSPAAGSLSGAIGSRIDRLFPRRIRAAMLAQLEAALVDERPEAIEFEVSEASGRSGWRECRFVSQGDNRMLAIVRDISERKQAEARVHRLAYFDALTGLPNRAHFHDIVDATLSRSSNAVGILVIDLDRFKRINDTLGMIVGDETLVETSRRLQRVIEDWKAAPTNASGDVTCLASFGGNAFAIMVGGDHGRSELLSLAEQIGRAIQRPIRIRGHEFVVTASIGIACSPLHGDTVESLIRNSESARLDAKSRGSNSQCLYRSTMGPAAEDCLDLETQLRRAIEQDELDVFYQPKVTSREGRIVGAEALLRWNHPERGLISPGTFIPLAEDAGLTPALGEWVSHHVCQQIAAWRADGYAPIPVALNVSAREFIEGDVLEMLLRTARAAGIATDLLELEITESMLISDISSVVASLHELREAGFSIAVDDFGTGYSSLRYLHRFPIDVLKIDRSFIKGIENSAESRSICSTIIALGDSLGLSIVGEGVETVKQQAFLEQEGCDTLQGFLFGKPVPASEFVASLPRADRRVHDGAVAKKPAHGLYCVEP